jgi:hypothetical protein
MYHLICAPGPWTPDRHRDAGTACPCPACQRKHPSADDWWAAHTSAVAEPPADKRLEWWSPIEQPWRDWERIERPPVHYRDDTEEVVNLQRRVHRRQRWGLIPGIIYREEDEAQWWPTYEELWPKKSTVDMIDRAQFDAWPARVPAARPKASRTPPPPRGDLVLHTDPSPRLTEVLEELKELRLNRVLLLIIQAATTDPAVAQALHHLRAQAARLRRQRPRQHRGARADAPPPAGHAAAPRRRASRR